MAIGKRVSQMTHWGVSSPLQAFVAKDAAEPEAVALITQYHWRAWRGARRISLLIWERFRECFA